MNENKGEVTPSLRIKLYGKRLGVKIIKTPPKHGSLYIPESAERNTMEAEVIFIGDEWTKKVIPGDRIIYDGLSGTRVVFFDEEYLILLESEVIAKLEGGEDQVQPNPTQPLKGNPQP